MLGSRTDALVNIGHDGTADGGAVVGPASETAWRPRRWLTP
jgi:hypothetical protein